MLRPRLEPHRLQRSLRLLLGALLIAAVPLESIEWNSPTEWTRLKLARSAARRGDELLEKGKYEKAENAYREAVAEHEELPTSYLGLGAALVGQGRYQDALESLLEAEQRYVDWAGELQMAALIQRQYNERRQRQIRDLISSVARGGASSGTGVTPEVQRVLRNLRKQLGQTRRTRYMNERLRPEDIGSIPPQVFYLEGIANLRLGRRDRGIECLRICLILDDEHGLAHYNLAVALFTRGQPLEAQPHLQAAVKAGVEPHPRFVQDLEHAVEAADS